MMRKRLSRKASRRNFRRGSKTQSANLRASPMRGGFRI